MTEFTKRFKLAAGYSLDCLHDSTIYGLNITKLPISSMNTSYGKVYSHSSDCSSDIAFSIKKKEESRIFTYEQAAKIVLREEGIS